MAALGDSKAYYNHWAAYTFVKSCNRWEGRNILGKRPTYWIECDDISLYLHTIYSYKFYLKHGNQLIHKLYLFIFQTFNLFFWMQCLINWSLSVFCRLINFIVIIFIFAKGKTYSNWYNNSSIYKTTNQKNKYGTTVR
jgi:hypothetical protein